MAKANSAAKKQNKINLQDLSERDRDILSLDVKDSMKKYKIQKQGVYDRRFALNKKLREAGITVDQVLNGKTAAPKKAKVKKEEAPAVQVNESRELMVVPEKECSGYNETDRN